MNDIRPAAEGRFPKVLREALAAVLVAALFAGCSTQVERDGPPPDPARASEAPAVVPKAEPRSRYGNPASYEVLGRRYYTLTSSEGFVERGVASWYGKKFHGRRTSSGEPYDMYKMTAAHKRLPLPTYVEVTNLDNGRKAIVKVNDRGPFHGNRIIDLSYAAALKLGIADAGTGFVEVRALTPGGDTGAPRLARAPAAATAPGAQVELASTEPVPPTATRRTPEGIAMPLPPPAAEAAAQARPSLAAMYLQVGAFNDFANAAKLRDRVREAVGPTVDIARADDGTIPRYRVQVGPVASVDSADSIVEAIEALGIVDHYFVTN